MLEINVTEVFSLSPGGRFRTDGPHSGEQFRDDILVPALATGEKILISLDGAFGYPSSFLEEAFGGLIRKNIINKAQARERLHFSASGSYEIYVEDIWRYIDHARAGG